MNINEALSFNINDVKEMESVIKTGVKFDEGYFLPQQTFDMLYDFIDRNINMLGGKEIKAYFDIVAKIAGNQKTNSDILRSISYKQSEILKNLCDIKIIKLKKKYEIIYNENKKNPYEDSTPNIFELIISDRDHIVFIPIAAGISTTVTSKVQEDLKKNKMVYYTLMNVELDWRNAILENYYYLKKKNLDKHDFNTKFLSRVNNIFRALTHRTMKKGEKVNRIYSTLTLLSSESRKHLHMNNQYLYSTYLVNAQPTLLVKLIQSLGMSIDDEYIEIVSTGKFYEIIMKYAAENNIIEDSIYNKKTKLYDRFDYGDRDQVKVLCYRGIFFYQHENKNIWEIFSELFPKTARSIKDIKEIDAGVTLASRLQNLEAEIFHNIILDSPYFIVHDAVYYIRKSDKKSIKQQIKCRFGENLSKKYKLKHEQTKVRGFINNCNITHCEGNIVISVKTKNKPRNPELILDIENLLNINPDYTNKEIGEILEIPTKTIANNISKHKLRA